ncbi:MAG TPA: hypothetical protein VF254_02480 [Gammaproteobacteria bacterium]
MIQETAHGATNGNAIAAGVTEANILADIRYFEARIEAAVDGNSRDQAMRRVYASLLAHRRQMLAALRDGRPDAWYEYEHVVV